MSACIFSSDPSREHAQMEQEEAAIFFIREPLVHSLSQFDVTCCCLLLTQKVVLKSLQSR